VQVDPAFGTVSAQETDAIRTDRHPVFAEAA